MPNPLKQPPSTTGQPRPGHSPQRTLAELADAVPGALITGPAGAESVTVTGFTHDSRAVLPGDLYAAMAGATVHGAHVEVGALIGIGAVVLGRARIGAGSLVAAGTVVRPGQQIPPGVLVAGVPARVVRELTDADRATFADTAAGYVRRAARHAGVDWTGPGGSP